MPVAGHAVRHHAGQQRFQPGQQSNGYGIGKQNLNTVPAHIGPVEGGQYGRDGPVASGYGIHGQVQNPHQQSAEDDPSHRGRNARAETAHRQHEDKRGGGHPQRQPRSFAQMLQIQAPFGEKLRRSVVDGQTEEIAHLRGKDGQGDPRRKARSHRIGNEFDDGPQAKKSRHGQDAPGQQGGDDQTVVAVTVDDTVDDDYKRAGGTADLKTAAAEQSGDQPRDNGRIQALDGLKAGGDGKGHGQRHGHHAHSQSGQNILAEIGAGIHAALQHGPQFGTQPAPLGDQAGQQGTGRGTPRRAG